VHVNIVQNRNISNKIKIFKDIKHYDHSIYRIIHSASMHVHSVFDLGYDIITTNYDVFHSQSSHNF